VVRVIGQGDSLVRVPASVFGSAARARSAPFFGLVDGCAENGAPVPGLAARRRFRLGPKASAASDSDRYPSVGRGP